MILVPLYLETFYRKIQANIKDQGKEKLVKVALVGDTHMKYVQNEDWSIEIQFYKKMGIGLAAEPHYWGIYLNASIDAPGWDNNQFIPVEP